LTTAGTDLRLYVSELAAATVSSLQDHGGRLLALPDAATEALRNVARPQLSAQEILSYFAVAPSDLLPPQSDLSDKFGQPPAVLFANGDFFIQALTWMEGTTAIHQHGFCGAFMVAEGQSLHVTYRFDEAETLTRKLRIGDLTMGSPEILNPGDVRIIEPGSSFIHALFHLVRPSVTIVIRNYKSDVGTTQYNYRRPGLACAPRDMDVLRQRRLQAMTALHALEPEKTFDVARELISAEDAWGAFQVADHCFSLWGWNQQFTPVLEVLGGRHPRLAAIAYPMYEEQWRVDAVLKRRTLLHERHQRTFLALLANLPDRTAIETVVGQLEPGRPIDEVLMEWIEELASPKLRGISGLTLNEDELARLRSQLESDSMTDSLGALSAKFSRSSLLTHLVP
jgi:hypothetical protein